MKKLHKRVLGTTAVLIGVAATAVALLLLNSHRKLNRVVQVQVAAVPYSTDPAAAGRGKYLFEARGCAECHGADGAGRVFIEHPNGLYARGANLTGGSGSAVLSYSESDWVRAIRHGVKPDGRPLFVMPSEDYNRFSDVDLADLVAHVRTLPAVDARAALVRLPLVARLAHGAGVLQDAAEKIDHTLAPQQPVAAAVSLEHGHYVVQTCTGCHGAKLAGGRIPGAPPDWPPAADLSLGAQGVLGRYQSTGQFKTMMRTGVRPDGTAVNPVMPFASLKHMNDTDMDALYLYLGSLGVGFGNH